MAGMDRITGLALSGWAHVAQSLGVLFTTPKGSRVMRRALGTDVPRLVDAPMSPATLIDFYAGAAEGIDLYEPRFKPTRFGTVSASADGGLSIACEGIYFPRGHLGDFSVSEPKNATVSA